MLKREKVPIKRQEKANGVVGNNVGSLTFGGLVMGGWSLGGRQDQIIGGKHHGGAIVILRLRSPWRSFGFGHFF